MDVNDQPAPQVRTGPVPSKTAWQPPQIEAVRPEVDEARERQPREEVHTEQRRRRRDGTLNRMVQFKLDCIPPEVLDLENYVYRWVNDESGKIRMATRHDDYDYVNSSELKGFDPDSFDSEGSETVRMLAGNDKFGNPVYTYLLKKRRSFWEADNEEVVRNREDMMAGRVHRGAIGEFENERTDDNFYATADSNIGGPAERRKGPIPKRTIR